MPIASASAVVRSGSAAVTTTAAVRPLASKDAADIASAVFAASSFSPSTPGTTEALVPL